MLDGPERVVRLRGGGGHSKTDHSANVHVAYANAGTVERIAQVRGAKDAIHHVGEPNRSNIRSTGFAAPLQDEMKPRSARCSIAVVANPACHAFNGVKGRIARWIPRGEVFPIGFVIRELARRIVDFR